MFSILETQFQYCTVRNRYCTVLYRVQHCGWKLKRSIFKYLACFFFFFCFLDYCTRSVFSFFLRKSTAMYKSSLVNQRKFCLAAPFMCSELSKGGLLRGFAELSQRVPIQFMAPGLKLTSGKRLVYFTLTFILRYLPGDSFQDMFYYYSILFQLSEITLVAHELAATILKEW